MRKILFLLFFSGINILRGQQIESSYNFSINNFYGRILNHNSDISHLITGRPSGVLLSVNQQTFGEKEWQRLYNYPDYGFSFIYQDLDNEFLGENYSVYLHWNFYFLKRALALKIGQGLAYASSPYDIDKNFRNIAYGSHIMSSTIAFLNYKKQHIFGGLGIQAGLGVVHYSNANVKAPNKSTNTLVMTIGATYNFQENTSRYINKEPGLVSASQPIGFGFFYRGGINESDVVGSGQYAFHTFGAVANKVLNKKSSIQVGSEIFFSKALSRFIQYRSIGAFEDGVTGEEDSKRIGVFTGHELRIHKISIITQLGFYVYYPFDYEGQFYNRMGARYSFNSRWSGLITVRSHGARAEAVEFSIQYDL